MSGVFPCRPRALLCHICGREYGTASLSIHISQCAKLWEQRQEQLPRKERRPVPSSSLSASRSATVCSSSSSIDLFNQQQQLIYEKSSLVKCQHCQRRFLPEKLPVHQHSCTRERPAKNVTTTGTDRGEATTNKRQREDSTPSGTVGAPLSSSVPRSTREECVTCQALLLPHSNFCSMCGKPCR